MGPNALNVLSDQAEQLWKQTQPSVRHLHNVFKALVFPEACLGAELRSDFQTAGNIVQPKQAVEIGTTGLLISSCRPSRT